MCNVDSHGGMDKNGNTAPPAPEEFFLFVVVVALHQLGAVGGFFWGSEGYPGSPQTTNLSTISPPREGQSLNIVVEWI